MYKFAYIILVAVAIILNSCSNGQSQTTKTDLTAKEFADKMKASPISQLLDVRTSEEFAKGHLENAINYDWNGSSFEKQISNLDKSRPVFVYCLSGGRSASAAKHMRANGFTEVYELEGGILKWRAANLPETTNKTPGMSKLQFDEILNSDKLVLIDFYADWCAPCKKMKPYLDEISKDMSNDVSVVRINVDDNQTLCKQLGIDALPVLQLYKKTALTWTHTGYIEKAEVLKVLK